MTETLTRGPELIGKPTLTPTNASRFSHCPAGAHQAVEQTERGKQQHSFAENTVAARYGITRTTAECTLTGQDLEDARWAADTALHMLTEDGATRVYIEKPVALPGAGSRAIRADILADMEAGLELIDLKFTSDAVSATDPQMLMTAAGVWSARRSSGSKPAGIRIAVICGKLRTVDVDDIPASAMDWITDHLVTGWISKACEDAPATHCPTWCIGCQRRGDCPDYAKLRDAIIKDASRDMHQAMYEAMSAVVQAVTEDYTTWSHTPADEPEPEVSRIKACWHPDRSHLRKAPDSRRR